MTDPVFPDLNDASVLITGGGSGIGAALTEGFLRQGSKVAFIDKADSRGFARELEERTGNTPLFLQGDITDIPALRQRMKQAAEANGPITVLVNNAADDQRVATLDVDESFFDASQAVNLKAHFFACQTVIPGMRDAGGGSIINVTSISYMMGFVGLPVYTSANSGLNGLTRSLAREFGPDRIRVNALAPGWVLTDKQMEMWASEVALAHFMERMCLKEHLKPDDMVGPCLFLASSASAAMTGQALVVDGGVVVTG